MVEAGILMSYGTSLADMFRQVGVYAGSILKGAPHLDVRVRTAYPRSLLAGRIHRLQFTSAQIDHIWGKAALTRNPALHILRIDSH